MSDSLRSKNLLPALPPGEYEFIIPYSPGRRMTRAADKNGSLQDQTTISENARKAQRAVLHKTCTGLVVTGLSLWLITVNETLAWTIMCLWMCSGALESLLTALTPTNIQLGAQGIRCHWLYPFIGLISSAWLPWTAVKHAALTDGAIKVEISTNRSLSIMQMLFWSAICLQSNLEFRSQSWCIHVNGITHESDLPPLIKVFKHFLRERCAGAISANVSKEQALSFTKLWLEGLHDPYRQSDSGTLVPGEKLLDGAYVIKEEIGAGGQAIVYSADRTTINGTETVVLKEFFLPLDGGKEIRARTLKNVEHEAGMLQQLNHPQIVKFIDTFATNYRAYLVTELIPGASLRKKVQENGPVSADECIAICKQLCDILTYMHELCPPVIHRDFTPDNLLLKEDGTVVLIDFNVAERLESNNRRTVVGKHSYIAPEQFRGTPNQQSDLYSTGCVMFWLLTGKDPEPISTSRPRDLKPTISCELDSIVARATAQDASERFGRAEEIKMALLAVLKPIAS